MTFTFIINPKAGRGRFHGSGNALERAARGAGLSCSFRYTNYRGHARHLAAEAAGRTDVVVAVGGDGTIHEVVSGLVEAGASARRRISPTYLGIVPSGTGNDFAKMFDLPSRLAPLMQVLKEAKTARVDYGIVRWEGLDGRGTGVFVNVAGAGFDAKVASSAAGFKKLRGTSRYLAAVLSTLRSWESPEVRVDLFHGGGELERVETSMLMVLVGNGRCAAGGFYLTPDATIVDGMLDVCIVGRISGWRIASLIPRVLRGRSLRDEPEIVQRRVRSLEVRSTVPLPVQADGEVLAERARFVHLDLVEKGLPIVMPLKS
ncbi:MAG: diacylglycerol kinase family protein [Rhodothermales bacterium]